MDGRGRGLVWVYVASCEWMGDVGGWCGFTWHPVSGWAMSGVGVGLRGIL